MRLTFVLALLLAVVVVQAQSWSRDYEAGIVAGKAGQWQAARDAFRRAIAIRPEDASATTTILRGGERTEWQEGAPYSPNLLAAYALYRQTLIDSDVMAQARLRMVTEELEALVQKAQLGRATLYFLGAVYDRLRDETRADLIRDRANRLPEPGWRVDETLFSLEERAAIGRPFPTRVIGKTGPKGPVPPISTKFALLIGNSTSKLLDLAVPTAADDVKRLRASLVTHAGYPDDHVVVLTDSSVAAIRSATVALAAKLSQGSTVFFYFAGVGQRRGGLDYLTGPETAIEAEASAMLRKDDVYRLLGANGASVFAFFECQRPILNGAYFGAEVPSQGRVSQVQATLPGEKLTTQTVAGRSSGTFAAAMIDVLADQHTNAIPITEFAWQVYYRIRQTNGIGGRQSPTLPVLVGLEPDAKF